MGGLADRHLTVPDPLLIIGGLFFGTLAVALYFIHMSVSIQAVRKACQHSHTRAIDAKHRRSSRNRSEKI
jgi:hypothetical protein